MADAPHMAACDYVGIVSANKEPNKFEKAGFHAVKSEFVDAPLIEELAQFYIFDHGFYRKSGATHTQGQFYPAKIRLAESRMPPAVRVTGGIIPTRS